jgi:hypothetical protein
MFIVFHNDVIEIIRCIFIFTLFISLIHTIRRILNEQQREQLQLMDTIVTGYLTELKGNDYFISCYGILNNGFSIAVKNTKISTILGSLIFGYDSQIHQKSNGISNDKCHKMNVLSV